jgi:hypothetical protein
MRWSTSYCEASLLAGHAAKTVNNVLTVLNIVLKTAVKWSVIPAMLCSIELLKVSSGAMTFYEFHDHRRLVQAAAKLDSRIVALVLLGATSCVVSFATIHDVLRCATQLPVPAHDALAEQLP